MKKKLHILFLCGWYPSRVLPKNGDFIKRHAKAVSSQHTVSVLHIISCKDAAETEIEIRKESGFNTYIAYVKPTDNPIVKLFRFWFAYKNLIGEIGNFDVVHLNKLYPFGFFALYLKKMKHTPYIISEHWTGYLLREKKTFLWIERFMSKNISKNASFICPVSNDLRKAMLRHGLSGNYKVIPNVVDTNLFIPQAKSNDEFTITHVSSLLDVHKNISGMLRVARKLEEIIPSFRWNFIGGNGARFKNLIDGLAFKKPQIHFTNHLNHQKIPEYLNASDIFVLFSNYENLPCVILEAFSCGIPVISTNVGGIKEFFPSEFGFLIQKRNEQQLLECIIKLYGCPKRQSLRMHQYAIMNFSSKKICGSFTKLYQSALD